MKTKKFIFFLLRKEKYKKYKKDYQQMVKLSKSLFK